MPQSHADCDHEKYAPAYRACREARAERVELVSAILRYFDERRPSEYGDWLMSGASRFGDYHGSSRYEAAVTLLGYFFPEGDETFLAYRRRNGYTVTSDPATIRSVILRAAS